jgi:hypothetical protein
VICALGLLSRAARRIHTHSLQDRYHRRRRDLDGVYSVRTGLARGPRRAVFSGGRFDRLDWERRERVLRAYIGIIGWLLLAAVVLLYLFLR